VETIGAGNVADRADAQNIEKARIIWQMDICQQRGIATR
jgi:hypothetical protein